jgi:hypothetical protein
MKIKTSLRSPILSQRPSKQIKGKPHNVTEGIQGFFYLKKINGKYLSDGLDTVP